MYCDPSANSYFVNPSPIGFVNSIVKAIILTMLKPLLILIALIIGGCQSNPPASETPGEQTTHQVQQLPDQLQIQRYQSALQLLGEKKYLQAEEILVELSRVLPGFSGSWVNLGLLKLLNKDPIAAKTYVERALKLTPELAQAMNLMGLIATHDRDIKLAESYYLRAIKQDSQYANAHYNLALLYDIYLQDLQRAVTHYQHYLANIDSEDSVTQGWVEQLQSTLKN